MQSPQSTRKPTVPWRNFTTAKPDNSRRRRAKSFAEWTALGWGWLYAPAPPASTTAPRALSQDEMRRIAPSISAAGQHVSRSERFRHPDHRGLARPGARGLLRRRRKTVGVAGRDQADYTRHMIRLRRLDDAQKYQVGDVVCEIILKNANDGTAAYELMAGLLRIRCLNSLVYTGRDRQLDQGSPLRRRAGKGRRRDLSRAWTGGSGVGRAARLEPHRAQ